VDLMGGCVCVYVCVCACVCVCVCVGQSVHGFCVLVCISSGIQFQHNDRRFYLPSAVILKGRNWSREVVRKLTRVLNEL